MLKILPFYILCHITTDGFSQAINDKGFFEPKNSGLPYYRKDKPLLPKVSPFGTLTTDEIREFKDALLIRINAAIFNLEDDSLALNKQYEIFWGKNFAVDYIAELKELKIYLDSGTLGILPAYKYVPDPKDIEALWTKNIYEVNPEPLLKPDYKEYHVVKTDLLATYILNRFKTTFGQDVTLKNWAMDMSYVKGWREIESWVVTAKNVKAAAESMKDNVFAADPKEIQKLSQQLKSLKLSNDLTTWIKNSNFIKQWLWYTTSQLSTNPLMMTSIDRKYPEKEKFSFLTPSKKAAQAELEKQDVLKKFQQTRKLYNQILMPLNEGDEKIKLHEFDLYVNPVVVKYPNEMLDEGEKLKVAIYNISSRKDVVLTQGIEPLKYPGRLLSELDTIAKIVGVLTSLGANNISTITALTGRLNPATMNQIQYKFAGVEPAPKLTEKFNWSLSQYLAEADKAPDTSNGLELFKPKRISEPATYALINTRYVPLSIKDLNEDKRRILYTTKAFTDQGKFRLIKAADKELIENFILIDIGFLDYRDNNIFKKNVDEMIENFRKYETRIKTRFADLNSLITDAISKHDEIAPYLRFINRDLPPDQLKPVQDKDPSYLTKITDINIPDAPKKINLNITSTDPKTKQTDDLAKETIKVIRTQRLDVSAGIGYTFDPYDIASQEGSALPTSRSGDATQFVAGLHIYFWKPLNRLHANPFRHADEKISLYIGLTLKNALDHYFAGLSYDLTPGIRLIGGYHFYNNPRFEIINNAVAKKASGLTNAGGFMALNIQAATLGKLIGLFK